MADVKAHFSTYFNQVHDNAQAKISTLNELLKSRVESIKEGLESTTTDLCSTLEDTLEELGDWFQPYVSMVTMGTF